MAAMGAWPRWVLGRAGGLASLLGSHPLRVRRGLRRPGLRGSAAAQRAARRPGHGRRRCHHAPGALCPLARAAFGYSRPQTLDQGLKILLTMEFPFEAAPRVDLEQGLESRVQARALRPGANGLQRDHAELRAAPFLEGHHRRAPRAVRRRD
jgi:hypothetical protein